MSKAVARPGAALGLAAVIAAIALAGVVRVRLADAPLERDEGEYAYAAQLILDGVPPYAQAYNMKFPGTYYAYAAILGVLGESAWAIRIGLWLVTAATTLVLYGLARRLLPDVASAAATAATFALLSVDRGVLGTFAHATHFILLPMLSGLALLLRAENTGRRLEWVGAGIMVGIAVLMKQQAAVFVLLLIVLGLRPAWNQRPRQWRPAIVHAFLVAGGALVPFLVVAGLLLAQGVFDRFWFWTFQYARAYVSQVTIADALGPFAEAWSRVTFTSLPVWILGGIGVLALWLVRHPRTTRVAVSGLAIASALSVMPGFYFRPHYFVLLLPVVSLGCGIAAASVAMIAGARLPRVPAAACGVLVSLIGIGLYVGADWRYLFRATPRQVHQALYSTSPFLAAPAVAEYIREHTAPGDRIAVLGSEPEIYFYADRRSASGHIYMYGLMEPQPFARRMHEELIAEIEAARPRFIVEVRAQESWVTRPASERLVLSWMPRYLEACYTPVGIAETSLTAPPVIRWDAEARSRSASGVSVLYTYRRVGDDACRAVPAP